MTKFFDDYSDEEAQDAVGGILTDTATVDFTYDDNTGTITADVIAGGVDHGGLAGLLDDDHTQYALLAGRSGGQTIIGGTDSGDDLKLQSSSHVTRGEILVDDDVDMGAALDVAGTLTAAGPLLVGSAISHLGDLDTHLDFTVSDRIIFRAGGLIMLSLKEGTTDEVVVNDGSADINFRWESNANINAFILDAGSDQCKVDMGIMHRYVIKTSAYTATTGDHTIICTGTWTLTLPKGSSFATFWIKNDGAGTITIDPDATELIDGGLTYALAAGEGIIIQPYKPSAYEWVIIARFPSIGVRTITSSDTATVTDSVIFCDATSAAITVTLPAASGSNRYFFMKKIDATANAVIVDGNASETIDNATTRVLSAQYDSIEIISDGTEWWII